MPKTISFHNGAAWSRGHNTRDERYTNKQQHIDSTLTAQNVTLCDVPVRRAYDEIFGQALAEYNAKQKRADRKITDYYNKIKDDKRKHTVYECIVQIGDRSDTGNAAEQEKQALTTFIQRWEKRNPNLKLIGAYIHCDEPDGTVHAHIDYIPVAQCTRGMKLQNSLDRALQQQGFSSENIHQTAQIAWQDSERKALCEICRDLNISVQSNQGIGKGRKYLTPQEYRIAKEQQQAQIEQELTPLKNELDKYINLDVPDRTPTIEEKKIPLTKRVSVPIEDFELLKEQATAYRLNRPEIEILRKQKEQGISLPELQWTYEHYEEQRKQLSDANSEIEKLQRELTKISQKDATITELQQKLRNLCILITAIFQALAMLRHPKSEFKANLTDKQNALLDVLTEKIAIRVKNLGYTNGSEIIKSGKAELAPSFREEISSKLNSRSSYDSLTGGGRSR